MIEIAKVNLKNTFRNIKSSGIVFLMPVIFMGIFALVFGQNSAETTYSISVLKDDFNRSLTSKKYLETIRNIKTPDGKDLFKITEYNSSEDAKRSIEKNENSAFIAWKITNKVESVNILGDTSDPRFNSVYGIFNNVTAKFFNISTNYLTLETLINPKADKITGFQVLAPGLMIYGILMLIPLIATQLAALKEKNYILDILLLRQML